MKQFLNSCQRSSLTIFCLQSPLDISTCFLKVTSQEFIFITGCPNWILNRCELYVKDSVSPSPPPPTFFPVFPTLLVILKKKQPNKQTQTKSVFKFHSSILALNIPKSRQQCKIFRVPNMANWVPRT